MEVILNGGQIKNEVKSKTKVEAHYNLDRHEQACHLVNAHAALDPAILQPGFHLRLCF